MEKENDLQKPEKSNKKFNMGYLFGIFMILIYFGMAYLLVFTPLFENTFSEIFRYSIGIVFAIYGIFRAYRQIRNRRYS
ncbi:hypothetical protein [Coprobacter sp.]